MDKFANVPHFSPDYFHSGFKLTSQEAAILRSEKGKQEGRAQMVGEREREREMRERER